MSLPVKSDRSDRFNPITYMRDPKYKSLIRMQDISLEDSVRMQIQFATRHLALANLQTEFLVYVHMYGAEAKSKFLEHGKSISSQSIQNIVTDLRKLDLIKGKGKSIELNNIVIVTDSIYYHLILNVTPT